MHGIVCLSGAASDLEGIDVQHNHKQAEEPQEPEDGSAGVARSEPGGRS
jgi:hypothetical protein